MSSNNLDAKQESSSKDDQHQSKTKQKRRNRHDPINRDFYCGCGRSYLSYPALYTHIKQKHDSQPPPGTIVPQDKKNQIKQNGKSSLKQEDNGSQYSYLNELTEPDPIEEIIVFLESLGCSYQKQNIQDREGQTEQQWIYENFPTNFFQDKEDYQIVFDILIQLINKQEFLQEELDVARDIKKTDLNRIFAIFLQNISPHLNKQIYKELCLFVCFYRKALNQYGWKMLGYQEDESFTQKEFCNYNYGESALMICNELVIDFLPLFFKQNEQIFQGKLEVLGAGEEQLKNAVYLIQHFASWLYANKYSNAKLAICTEENYSIL